LQNPSYPSHVYLTLTIEEPLEESPRRAQSSPHNWNSSSISHSHFAHSTSPRSTSPSPRSDVLNESNEYPTGFQSHHSSAFGPHNYLQMNDLQISSPPHSPMYSSPRTPSPSSTPRSPPYTTYQSESTSPSSLSYPITNCISLATSPTSLTNSTSVPPTSSSPGDSLSHYFPANSYTCRPPEDHENYRLPPINICGRDYSKQMQEDEEASWANYRRSMDKGMLARLPKQVW
jgi:hypothetical protein